MSKKTNFTNESLRGKRLFIMSAEISTYCQLTLPPKIRVDKEIIRSKRSKLSFFHHSLLNLRSTRTIARISQT